MAFLPSGPRVSELHSSAAVESKPSLWFSDCLFCSLLSGKTQTGHFIQPCEAAESLPAQP